MNWIQALILGLVQGLTEYLPVSSSGHLEIGKMILGTDPEAGGLAFDVAVHIATMLATLLVLWKEVAWVLRGLTKLRWNGETRYALNIVVSMVPIAVVGFCFKDSIEELYANEHVKGLLVGCCLLVTAILLALTHYCKPRPRTNLSPWHAFLMGIAQAAAVLPGLSRSGSTIATGLLLGNKKEMLAQFSFLMVIPPILGEALLDLRHIASPVAEGVTAQPLPAGALVAGFVAAFVSGCFACKWMITLVRQCKLIYFAIYCAVAGVLVLTLA